MVIEFRNEKENISALEGATFILLIVLLFHLSVYGNLHDNATPKLILILVAVF